MHVGQTEYEAGLGGGKKMKEAGVTKAICINQEVGNVALDLRCKGFTDGLGAATSRWSRSAWTRPRFRTPSQASLSANPEHQWRAGAWTVGRGAGPRRRSQESAMLDKVKFGTFDLSPGVLKAIADGKMMFAIDQQQFLQGYLPIALLKNDMLSTGSCRPARS